MTASNGCEAEAPGNAAGLADTEAPGAGHSAPQAANPAQERVKAMWKLGIPAGSIPEPQWSADLFTPTVADMGAGHPLNGVSPWQ